MLQRETLPPYGIPALLGKLIRHSHMTTPLLDSRSKRDEQGTNDACQSFMTLREKTSCSYSQSHEQNLYLLRLKNRPHRHLHTVQIHFNRQEIETQCGCHIFLLAITPCWANTSANVIHLRGNWALPLLCDWCMETLLPPRHS